MPRAILDNVATLLETRSRSQIHHHSVSAGPFAVAFLFSLMRSDYEYQTISNIISVDEYLFNVSSQVLDMG